MERKPDGFETDITEEDENIVDNIGTSLQEHRRQLDLTGTQLAEIQGNDQINAYKMMKWWQQNHGQEATKSVLVQALRNIGRNDIADKLKKTTSKLKQNLTVIARLQESLRTNYSCISIPQPPGIYKDIPIDDMFIDQDMEKYSNTAITGNNEILHIEDLFQPVNGKQATRILVEGDSGDGKTTLAMKLAADWANKREYISSLYNLVILILLRDVNTENIEEFIAEIIRRALGKPVEITDIKKFLVENKVLLILHGFDKISAERRKHLRNILVNKEEYLNSILVTSRRGVFTVRKTSHFSRTSIHFEDNEDIGYDFCDIHVQLKGFTKQHRNQILKNQFNIDVKLAESKINELFSENNDELFCCPLFVFWLGCIIERVGVKNMQTRTMFYKALFNFILHKTLVRERKIEESVHLDVFRSSTDQLILSVQQEMCKVGTLALDRLIRYDFTPFKRDEIHSSSESILFVSDIFMKIKTMHNMEETENYHPRYKSFLEFLAAFTVCYSEDSKDLLCFKNRVIRTVENKIVPSEDSLFYPFIAGLMENRAQWLIDSLLPWSSLFNVCEMKVVTILTEITLVDDDVILQSLLNFVPKLYTIYVDNSGVRKNFYLSDLHQKLFNASLQNKLIQIIQCSDLSIFQNVFSHISLKRLCLEPSNENPCNSLTPKTFIHCDELVHSLDGNLSETCWDSYLQMQAGINADQHILDLFQCQSNFCTIVFNEIESSKWRYLSFQRVTLSHCELENSHLESVVRLIEKNQIIKGVALFIDYKHKLTADAIDRLWKAIAHSTSIDEFSFQNTESKFETVFDLTLITDSKRKQHFQALALNGYFTAILNPPNLFEVQELMLFNRVNQRNTMIILSQVANVKCLGCSYGSFSWALENKIPLLKTLEKLHLDNTDDLCLPDNSFIGWDQMQSLQAVHFNVMDFKSIPPSLEEFIVSITKNRILQILGFDRVTSLALFSCITKFLSEVDQKMLANSLELLLDGEWVPKLLPDDFSHVKHLMKQNRLSNVTIVDYYSLSPLPKSVLPSLFPENEFQFEVEIFGSKRNHSISSKQVFNRLKIAYDMIRISLKPFDTTN